MPAKSAKQLRFMYATAAGKTDAPRKVGLKFIKETPEEKKRRFMKGK